MTRANWLLHGNSSNQNPLELRALRSTPNGQFDDIRVTNVGIDLAIGHGFSCRFIHLRFSCGTIAWERSLTVSKNMMVLFGVLISIGPSPCLCPEVTTIRSRCGVIRPEDVSSL